MKHFIIVIVLSFFNFYLCSMNVTKVNTFIELIKNNPKELSEVKDLLLLEKVDAQDSNGKTMLFYAASDFLLDGGELDEYKTTLVKLLLDAGANPNLRDNNRDTPLHRAALHTMVGQDKADMVQMLLKAGADANSKNSLQLTPLHVVFSGAHPPLSVLEALLHYGADANAQDEVGNTPLHYAVRAGFSTKIHGLMKILLEKGNGNPFIKNKRGETVFDVSNKADNTQITQLLKNYTQENREGARKAWSRLLGYVTHTSEGYATSGLPLPESIKTIIAGYTLPARQK
ncbi:ankyrin repeat domain-containing protein [Candidatus Dependentiae bacterium]|nr:ankyrin repeat domain-containing protein [Candidatus Dependentiae bacterium]